MIGESVKQADEKRGKSNFSDAAVLPVSQRATHTDTFYVNDEGQ